MHGNIDYLDSTNQNGEYDYSIKYESVPSYQNDQYKDVSQLNIKSNSESKVVKIGGMVVNTADGQDVPTTTQLGLGSVAFGGTRYNYLKYRESWFLDSNDLSGSIYFNSETATLNIEINEILDAGNELYSGNIKLSSTASFQPGAVINPIFLYNSKSPSIVAGQIMLNYVPLSGTDWSQISISLNNSTTSYSNLTFVLSPYYDNQPTSAEGNQALAGGASTHAFGDWSFAMGHNNKIYGKSGAVFGGGNRVGQETANTSYSFNLVAGETNNVIGRSNAVFGANNGTEDVPIHGNYNLIAGQSNRSTNIASYNNVILGSNNEISGGHDSFVSGNSNTVTSSHAFVSGITNTVSGGRAAALGELNKVTGNNSTAINYANKADGYGSFVFGGGNSVAKGTNYSAAGGTASAVKASYSFAFGQGLSAGYANQFIIGRYNDNLTDSLFEIGNGEPGSGKQKNAFAVSKSGEAKIQNKVTVPILNVTANSEIGHSEGYHLELVREGNNAHNGYIAFRGNRTGEASTLPRFINYVADGTCITLENASLNVNQDIYADFIQADSMKIINEPIMPDDAVRLIDLRPVKDKLDTLLPSNPAELNIEEFTESVPTYGPYSSYLIAEDGMLKLYHENLYLPTADSAALNSTDLSFNLVMCQGAKMYQFPSDQMYLYYATDLKTPWLSIGGQRKIHYVGSKTVDADVLKVDGKQLYFSYYS